MKRWTHLHSIAAGAAFPGLFLARHGWALFLAGVLVGVAIMFAVNVSRRLVGRVDRMLPDANRTDSGRGGEPAAGLDAELAPGPGNLHDQRIALFDRVSHDLTMLAAMMPRQRRRVS